MDFIVYFSDVVGWYIFQYFIYVFRFSLEFCHSWFFRNDNFPFSKFLKINSSLSLSFGVNIGVVVLDYLKVSTFRILHVISFEYLLLVMAYLSIYFHYHKVRKAASL